MTPLKTVEQAAEVLNIPKWTLTKLVTARKVQHTRIGRHVRFTDADLEAYAASCRVPADQPTLTVRTRRKRAA